jgi:hypothetical protein
LWRWRIRLPSSSHKCSIGDIFGDACMTMQDVTFLVFVKTFWTRITPVFFLGRHHRICHQLNIYGMKHHYQKKSWRDRNCRAVWMFVKFSNVCDYFLHQHQLRIFDA